MSQSIPQTNVRFLALEGGGGKGFAYLGAIEALESLRVVQFDERRRLAAPLEGVAGASAGAITALLLSCGFSASEIRGELESTDFASFFDRPTPGSIPTVFGRPRRTLSSRIGMSLLRSPTQQPVERLVRMLVERLVPREYVKFVPQGLGFSGVLQGILQLLGPPFSRLGDPMSLMACLLSDFGLFDGRAFHRYFARIVARGLRRIDGQEDDRNATPNYRLTFSQHHARFGVRLGVMASNLETGKSVFFSPETTPNFPVAAAVRVSMSLPLIFKPLVFRDDDAELSGVSGAGGEGPELSREELAGVWVDGGLMNNIPLRVLDESWGRSSDASGQAYKTLGLRLEREEPRRIGWFGAFLWRYIVELGMFGAGESHINRSLLTQHRTVLLDTTGLDLLDFSPPEDELAEEIRRKSFVSVYDYFGYPHAPRP